LLTVPQDVFLYGVVVPVIPFALEDRVHISHGDTQHWVSVLLSVYAAGLLFFAPICGILADWTSHRRGPFLAGLLLLSGSTLMLCFGKTIPILVVGRLLQGISAAVVWVVALALMADTVSEAESGQAIGYVSVATSMGVLVAPLIGGVVYERSGYYAVFGVTFAVIGFDILLRLALVEKKIAAKWLEPEPSTVQRASAAPGQTEVELEDRNESTAVMEKKNAATAIAEPRDVQHKRKLPSMLILLKSRRIMVAFWGNLVGAMTFTALDTTLPLYVNQIFGWNSLGAGLVFLALVVPGFAGPWIGHLTDKYGPRWIAASGLLMSVPFWVLLRLVDHDTVGQAVLLCGLLVLLGAATCLLLTPLMAEFSKVCDAKVRQEPDIFRGKSAYAQSYGIFNVSWAGGSLLGPLVSAAVKNGAGWKTMTWTMALWFAAGILPTVLYSGGMITKTKRPMSMGRVQAGDDV
jgi:MFS family permease